MAGRSPPIGLPDTESDRAGAAHTNAMATRQSLPALRDTLESAQRAVWEARLPPADAGQLRLARVAHLLAMTQFEQALTRCRLPIPPRLLQEARLLRRLLG